MKKEFGAAFFIGLCHPIIVRHHLSPYSFCSGSLSFGGSTPQMEQNPGLTYGVRAKSRGWAFRLPALFSRRHFVRSVAEQVRGHQAAGYWVDCEGSLFEGDHAKQTGLVYFGEYDWRVELQSLESDRGFAHIDRDHPAASGL